MSPHPHIQTLIDLRYEIEDIKRIKLQKSWGIPIALSPLQEIIDAMIENAQINFGGVSTECVFAIWRCAQDAVDTYTDPRGNPEARKPSNREVKELERYIADAKAATINSSEKSACVIAIDGKLILRLGNYAREYVDEDDAAEDWDQFIRTRSTADWEDHDPVAADVIVDVWTRYDGTGEFSEQMVAEYVKSGRRDCEPDFFQKFIDELRLLDRAEHAEKPHDSYS